MNVVLCRRGLVAVLAALCLGVFAAPATAAEYEFNALYSLTGDCSVTKFDPVEDPSCPEQTPSGRFQGAVSTVLDFYGNEYVANWGGGTGGRIDIFDDEGRLITELDDPFGPKSTAVDSKGNLYVVEAADDPATSLVRYTPTVYKPAAGEIEYGNPRVVIDSSELTGLAGVAIDPGTDRLFAAWNADVIKAYGSAAEENKQLGTITHEKLHSTVMVGVDGERRRLYASSCQAGIFECGVLVFAADPPYALLKELDGSNTPAGEFSSSKGWLSTAVNEESGHFFVGDTNGSVRRIYEFDENYQYVSSISSSGFEGGLQHQIGFVNSPLNAEAENRHFLFSPVSLPSGRALAFNPATEFAPDIKSSTVASIGERGAELRATIDPRGGDTSYVFKYVTEEEFAQAGFSSAAIAGEGTIGKESQPIQVTALLSGLAPGTTYRFLVVATNAKGVDEESGRFATYLDASTDQGGCPNQLLRIGFSSGLPDCRSYELVTPADTNARPPKGVGFSGDRFTTLEASPLGNAVSFTTEGGSLPGHEGTGGFNGDLYRATRSSSGWTTDAAGPGGTETNILTPGSTSPDQGHSFWGAGGEGSAVVDDRTTHYVRYPDGRSELVGRGSLGTDSTAVGKLITEGGGHIVFQTVPSVGKALRLEPEAPPTGTGAVYDTTADGVTHVVSLLPGNVSPGAGEHATYLGASADGEGIAFSIDNTLYLRKDNAVTHEIGVGVVFAGVSEGGDRIFYVEGGDLYAFDTETEEAIAFTSVGNATFVNVAPSGSRIYFTSTTAISGAGQSPNGDSPKAGQQNLYLSEEGTIDFVATVTERDVKGEVNSVGAWVDGLGLWTEVHATQPAKDPSRVTPDGSVLLFQSRANLVGYDPGGFPQVYRFDSGEERLHCLSCIPTKAPAAGGASLETFAASMGDRPPFSAYGFVPNLRSDGDRAFFESKEALVSADTNQAQDVYEWEEGGVGSCTQAGGCVYLITSGQSARDNYLYGVSRSGDDVFFVTEDTLVGGDDDAPSIYDARVGGGFPKPYEVECAGEGCRPVLVPPQVQIEPERPVEGNENFRLRRCPKGKRKVKRHGKVRCVKKHRQKRKHKAGARRGAVR